MNAYRKTIAAVLGAAGTWCLAALPDGKVGTMEWVALGIAVATALGVYAVPNDTQPEVTGGPKARQHGYGAVELLVIVVLIVILPAVLLRAF